MGNQKKVWLWVLIAGLMVWSFFARPVYDSLRIAGRRGVDQLRERLVKPFAVRKRAAVVDASTANVKEIEEFLRGLCASENGKAQRLRNQADGKAALLSKLKASLGLPLPGDGAAPAKVSAEEAVGEDELASYRRLTIPVVSGVNTTGLYILPRKRQPGRRIPLVVVAEGRGACPGTRPIINSPC